MRIDFYHLERSNLDTELPFIMEGLYAEKKRVLIRTDSPERTDYIGNLLWTYNSDKWLPHGTVKDGRTQKQPIFITEGSDNPNNATVLAVVSGEELDFTAPENKAFEHILIIFSAHDMTAKDNARKLWLTAKEKGYELYYLKR